MPSTRSPRSVSGSAIRPEDVQFLIETVFALDSRFTFAGVKAAAEDAFEMARTNEAGLIVLDHGLAGKLTGLQAAPRFKEAFSAQKSGQALVAAP